MAPPYPPPLLPAVSAPPPLQPSKPVTPNSAPPQPLPLPAYLQEHELPQDCKELIASLPAEKGWVASYLHQYQGFWHTTRQLIGVLACQKQFQAQASDVLLVTTPKAGTTWLKALIYALVNRVRFQLPDIKLQHPLLTTNPHVLVPFMELEYIDNDSPELSKFTSPRVLSTHLPLASLPTSVVDSGCKIVYLCRNPKDTFVSLWHFTNRLRPKEKGENSLEEAFHKFCRGVSLYGPFWDHVLGYWEESLKNTGRVLFLKYEEMRREPNEHLRKLSEFLGCRFTPEEDANGVVDEIVKVCSFENLSNLEVNRSGKLSSGEANEAFFRRGQVGDSVNYLTHEMQEMIDQITAQKLGGSKLMV